MTSSSPRTCRHEVFPSFSGEDVRKSFLSHLLKELNRKLVDTFIDNNIERSRPIGPELRVAIRKSRISIVILSKKYASSTWCLNELVEIYKCYMEHKQMVIPIFYKVDPSDVKKQTGEFGKAFEETCKGKTEDDKGKWVLALTEVAKMAGEDFGTWFTEADMIEKIANDVSNKLMPPSNDFGSFIGIEAHIVTLNSMLRFDSEEPRMIGISGPSGIGKSTIGRALYSTLMPQFHHRAFVQYKRTKKSDYEMKLFWEEQFLSEILSQKDIKIYQLGVVEKKLKDKKVLIVLDDVDDIELLKTLVGQIEWFGFGSKIVVISKDRKLLKFHKIDHVYEVDFPSEELALQMFCGYAFGQNSPPREFTELAAEVTKLAGNLPFRLKKLGSSFIGKDKDEWVEWLSKFRNGKTEKTLKVSYDGLEDDNDQANLYNAGRNLLGDSVNTDASVGVDKLMSEGIRASNDYSKRSAIGATILYGSKMPSGSNSVDKALVSPVHVPVGSANGHLSWSHASTGREKLVTEGVRTSDGFPKNSQDAKETNCFAKVTTAAQRNVQSGSNGVDNPLASPVSIPTDSKKGHLSYSESLIGRAHIKSLETWRTNVHPKIFR